MFNNVSFKRKIGLLVGVAIGGLVLLSAVSVLQLRQQIVEGRTGQLVSVVQSAAAAESLKEQAQRLSEVVQVFRLASSAH